MRPEVAITPEQARERYADLLAAIGAPGGDPGRSLARRGRRRQARRTGQRYAWLRRVSQA